MAVPRKILCLLMTAGSLFAEDLRQLELESLFYRSQQWSKIYAAETAKAKAPQCSPLTQACLKTASVFASIEGETLAALTRAEFWDRLQSLGVQAADVRHLDMQRRGNAERDWAKAAELAAARGISLIGHPFAPVPLQGPDFQLALRNVRDYPHLFHLIAVDRADWPYLPRPGSNQTAPLSMAEVQELRRKGYLDGKPEEIYPYAKTSAWEASGEVAGADGIARRWIFLREAPSSDPALNWLDPSFAALRLAGGEILDAIFHLRQSILVLDLAKAVCQTANGAAPASNALESLALLARKLGAFTALAIDAPLKTIQEAPCDLVYDRFTWAPLLHALLYQDAEALRLMYRILLEEKVDLRAFIHELPPAQDVACTWSESVFEPEREYRYHEERITGRLLLDKLRKEDLRRLGRAEPQPAPFCLGSLGLPARHLLAFFYALQPGAFSFPLDKEAKRLGPLLAVRNTHGFEQAELVDVFRSQTPSLAALLLRLPNGLFALTAVNFSKSDLVQELQHPALVRKWAVELMTGLAEPKLFASDKFTLHLNPLAGKVFVLQPKHFEE